VALCCILLGCYPRIRAVRVRARMPSSVDSFITTWNGRRGHNCFATLTHDVGQDCYLNVIGSRVDEPCRQCCSGQYPTCACSGVPITFVLSYPLHPFIMLTCCCFLPKWNLFWCSRKRGGDVSSAMRGSQRYDMLQRGVGFRCGELKYCHSFATDNQMLHCETSNPATDRRLCRTFVLGPCGPHHC